MGSQGADKNAMLQKVGFNSLDELVSSTVPKIIRLPKNLSMDEPLSETQALAKLKGIMSKNKVLKSFIGTGYYETLTPGVILRNVSQLICMNYLRIIKCLTNTNIIKHFCYIFSDRFLKTLVGIPHTHHIKQKLPKVVFSLY
jgi:hypothetical protein